MGRTIFEIILLIAEFFLLLSLAKQKQRVKKLLTIIKIFKRSFPVHAMSSGYISAAEVKDAVNYLEEQSLRIVKQEHL